MPISDSLSEFKGKKVVDWDGKARPADFVAKVFRVRVEYDEADEGVTLSEKIAAVIDTAGSDQIESLVIGAWQPDDTEADSSGVVEALVSARDKLPRLRNLFIGDITFEECEISWIQQS